MNKEWLEEQIELLNSYSDEQLINIYSNTISDWKDETREYIIECLTAILEESVVNDERYE